MPRLYFRLFLIVLLVGCLHSSIASENPIFETLKMSNRDHWYSHFKTTVINTPQEYRDFLKSASIDPDQPHSFHNTVASLSAWVDTHTMVLIRHTESSGSTKVSFQVSQASPDTLLCKISRIPPGPCDIGTCDMAYYCFGIMGQRSLIKKVEVFVNDVLSDTILLPPAP